MSGPELSHGDWAKANEARRNIQKKQFLMRMVGKDPPFGFAQGRLQAKETWVGHPETAMVAEPVASG
jgi:hypothetical protein